MLVTDTQKVSYESSVFDIVACYVVIVASVFHRSFYTTYDAHVVCNSHFT